MRQHLALAIAIVALRCPVQTTAQQNPPAAPPTQTQALQNEAAVLTLDLDGDGRLDSVRVTKDQQNHVLVSARLPNRAGHARVESFSLGIGAGCQECVCSWPVRLVLERLDYDPDPEGVGPIPGYRKSTKAQGFRLENDDCDAVHVFWNQDTKHIDWWRL